jgi:hypothetical protein
MLRESKRELGRLGRSRGSELGWRRGVVFARKRVKVAPVGDVLADEQERRLVELQDAEIKVELDRRERALRFEPVVRRLSRVGSADLENASAATDRRFRLELVCFRGTQKGKVSMG